MNTQLANNRINTCFAQLKEIKRKALIPFMTAGDPSLEAGVPVMHALVAAGADVIELGVPFSDPMADGPTIQRSSERALVRGANLDYVLNLVAEFRQKNNHTPIVLMGYLNPVEIRGARQFAKTAGEAGVDGILLVDLPPEEAESTRVALNAAGLALIMLAAPTTEATRLDRLCQSAQGYLYYVNFAGVTGAATRLDSHAANVRLRQLRKSCHVPVVAGFGITDAVSAKALASGADGVVIGSALVATLADSHHSKQAADRASEFLRPLRQALDQEN